MRSILLMWCLLAFAGLGKAAEPLVGRWWGTIDIPGRQMKIIVDLDHSKSAGWIGSVVMPGFNVKGAALTGIEVRDGEVSFAIARAFGPTQATAPTLKGRIDAAGRWIGKYQQAGHSAHFALVKTGPPDVETKRVNASFRPELVGAWVGAYEFSGYGRKVTMTLSNGPGGGVVEWVVIGKQTTKLATDLVTQEGDFVRLDASQPGFYFEGQFHKDRNQIKGTFVQGPFEIPLTMRKAD